MERKPGKNTDGDKVDANEEHRKRIIEKLMGEINTDVKGLSTKKRLDNQDIPHKDSSEVDKIHPCVKAFEKDSLTVFEQVHAKDACDTEEHEFSLPAHMSRCMTECPLQIH
jgi:hypothetical protein